MDQLKQLVTRALESLRDFRATNPNVFRLLVAAIALTVAICAGFYWFNPGAPIVLATNLAPADRTALALRLRRHRIDFTLGPDSVSVPSGELVVAQRLLESGPGFPGGSEDFGLFDQPPMGQSDFAEQVNYQRSLQGELERTIMDIHGVDSARVMLAMGRPSPFALGTNDVARASVMLTIAPGSMLDSTTAQAIAHLVASSVRGLKVENVTITGNNGTIFYPPQHTGELDDAMRLRNDFEHRLEEKASGLLTRIMGENRYAVEVAVDVDTSRVSSRDTLYGKGDQAILSEEHSITPARDQVGGIPGLTSNLPTPAPAPTPRTATPTTALAAARPEPQTKVAEQTATKEVSRKDIVNYRPSARQVNTVTAPVRIKRITVAAVLDGTYDGGHFAPLSPDRLEAIKSLLAAAVGADLSRGDLVDVQSAALSQPYVPPVPNPIDQLRSLLSNPLHLAEIAGAGLAFLVLMMWLLIRTVSRSRRRRREAKALSAPAQSSPQAEASLSAPATTPAPPEMQPSDKAATGDQAGYEEIRARLNQEVDRDPAAAAETLRQWLESTNSNGAANGHLH